MDKLRKPKKRGGGTGSGAEGTQMKIRKRDGTSVIGTKYVDITQEQAPI